MHDHRGDVKANCGRNVERSVHQNDLSGCVAAGPGKARQVPVEDPSDLQAADQHQQNPTG